MLINTNLQNFCNLDKIDKCAPKNVTNIIIRHIEPSVKGSRCMLCSVLMLLHLDTVARLVLVGLFGSWCF